MALLHSEQQPLGQPLPAFSLLGVDGQLYSPQSFAEVPIIIVMFICSHCPYVQAVEDRIIQLRKDYEKKGVQLVGVCSNDPTDYPDDAPEALKKRWESKKYGFPYLIDAEQNVAKIFGAVCTPEFYVYNQSRRLAYHGQLDNNWKNPTEVTRHDLREALDLLLDGKTPSAQQTPSMGCSIKWKK